MFIALGWNQLKTGLEGPVLEDVTQNINYIRNNMLLSLRDGLSRHGARLRIFSALQYPKLRLYDEHLMQLAIDGEFKKTKLLSINLCRLFVGVITTVDITTPDGRRIDRKA